MMNRVNGPVSNKWRIATCISIILICALIVAVIAVHMTANKTKEVNPQTCGSKINQINLEEPENPPVFHDLTKTEISGLMEYLYSQSSLNLVKPFEAFINTSHIFTAEIYLPNKSEVLDFLDKKGQKPAREAIVTIFRGDESTPYVQEIIVGPLPNPNYMKDVAGRLKPIPFIFRPFSGSEFGHIIMETSKTRDLKIGKLLKESFGGTLTNCGKECLVPRFIAPTSPAVTGEYARKYWLNVYQFVEYFALHPVDFALQAESRFTDVVIQQVWYNGKTFRSLDELLTGYNNGSVSKIKIPFPKSVNREYGKLSPRGDPFQEIFQREPVQVEPDGKRYSVQHNHVTYRGWSFDYRMSTSSGPQVYDIRFLRERIVYEISLQEILVMYSGNKPSQMFVNYFDSYSTIGMRAMGLVSGVDCPEHATLIDTVHVSESSEKPLTNYNAFCLFELNTGIPLRRHHAYRPRDGMFYEGLSSNVLVFRSIATIANYDYILDFIFFENGVIQVKAVSTGYIMATFPNDEELDFGMKIQDFVNGNLHIHAFNFKVDLDIKGITNRYETLDIVPHAVPNKYSTVLNATYHMTKFTRTLKKSELQATYKFNFDKPQYLLFYNDREKNVYGNPKAYRLLTTGIAKQLFAEGQGNEPSASWARYQMAVTKFKDTERKSGSIYSSFDASDPVIQFQNYLNDDENIVDKDLVPWVTLAVHHIPHTEDLPVTPSPGMELSFFLLPFNYFTEDPAIASLHSVRIEMEEKSSGKTGIAVKRHEIPKRLNCLPTMNPFYKYISDKPEVYLPVL